MSRAPWVKHFGLTKTPFTKTIAANQLFGRDGHAEAVARISFCVQESALGVITGDVGAGKTVAVRAAVAQLDPTRHHVIYIPNPAFGTRGLYVTIVSALGAHPRFHKAEVMAQAATLLAAETAERHRRPVSAVTDIPREGESPSRNSLICRHVIPLVAVTDFPGRCWWGLVVVGIPCPVCLSVEHRPRRRRGGTMARRAIEVRDIVELMVHWHAGRRIGEVAQSLGVDPKTIRKYTAPAIEAGLVPGGPPLSVEEWSGLVAGWFPELADRAARAKTWPEIEQHRDLIKSWLGVVTIATIHQRLRDDHRLGASESSLRRFIWANVDDDTARNAVRVLRDTPPAGEEAQVDYGLLGRWFDPVSQRVRRVQGFMIVLVYSRLMFLRPVLVMDQASWVEAHVLALEFFSGVPARIVPDNLKTGVIKPDLYDPKINRAFGEFAEHYGCLVDPARALKPRDKATVERHVPYARDSFFAGRSDEFDSLAAMQADALRWCRQVANQRQCRPLDRVAPQVVFDAEEQGALGAMPRQPFGLASWSSGKVGPDIHVKVGKALYSVPWKHIGAQVDARAGARTVEVFLDGKLIKTHARIDKGRQTDRGDYPPEKIAFFMNTPAWCRRRANELGPHVAAVVVSLMEVNALYRLRSAQGVVGLADKHGAERLNAACRRAIQVGDPTYKTVKGILAAGTENEGADRDSEPVSAATSAPAHLHGPARLFDVEAAQ